MMTMMRIERQCGWMVMMMMMMMMVMVDRCCHTHCGLEITDRGRYRHMTQRKPP
jgi:hypothetical protein